MNINFEYFRIFYAVARYQNITKAAEELFLSRPTVTQELQRLEKQIGFPLFIRNSRGVSLTDKGKELFLDISPAIQTLLNAEKRLDHTNALAEATVVNLSFTRGHTLNAYEGILDRFRSENPDIILRTTIIPYETVADNLNSGFAQLVFGARHSDKVYPEHTDINLVSGIIESSFGVFDDYIITHKHLEFLQNKGHSLASLKEYPFILYKDRDADGFNCYLDNIGQSDQIRSRNLILSDISALFSLLRTGDYIAIVPSFALNYLTDNYIRLQIDDPIVKTEYLVNYSDKKPPTPAAMKLVDYLRANRAAPRNII